MNIDFAIFDLDIIEQEMKTHWPSNKIVHRSVAIKYYGLCRQAIIKGIDLADSEAVKLNLIPVSFKQIRDQLGRYGARGQEQYWFDWFQKHHALLQPVIRGTNFGRNKRGSLTMIKNTREIQSMLELNSSEEIFQSYYGNVPQDQLDYVTVDLDSLAAYIEHNHDTQRYAVNNPQHLSRLKQNAQQALLILTLAAHNQGRLPQHRSVSQFGRLYYQGPNLQSTAKIVRHAALGRCYQYDIEASVFTWKLDMVKDFQPTIKLPETLDYLDYKQHHRQRLAELIFGNHSDYSVNTVKQVITAVGFGARTTNAVGWYHNGQWTTTAIRDIIKSTELIDRLFADQWFSAFVTEQTLMSQLIFDHVKDLVKDQDFLLTSSGRLSRNRTISYCYQQAEAMIVKRLEKALKAQDNRIELLCHDGFYTKTRADVVDLRYELQQYLPHGRLEEIAHTAFKYAPDSVIEEAQHRARIQQEEQQVAALLNIPLHQPRALPKPKNQRNEEYDSGYDDGTRAYLPPQYVAYDDTEYQADQMPTDIQQRLLGHSV